MSCFKETLHRFGIAVNENTEEPVLSCYQMIRMYMAAKQDRKSVTLPMPAGAKAAGEDFAAFLLKYQQALEDVTPGLPKDFYAGNSTLSRDKKTLYLFDYSVPKTEIMVKGIKNKIISISLMPSEKGVNRDTSTGLCGSPGTLWLNLPSEDVQKDCTVIKIALKGELDLFLGIGAPITQN